MCYLFSPRGKIIIAPSHLMLIVSKSDGKAGSYISSQIRDFETERIKQTSRTSMCNLWAEKQVPKNWGNI